ncbi:MAG: glycoside hydrolase family 172 protein [Terriglobales bacterium]
MRYHNDTSERFRQFGFARRLTLLCLIMAVFASRPIFGQDFSSLPVQKDYTQERVSSADPTGGNDDGNWKNPIKAGEERTIANLTGPGVITHMWFTIASSEQYHLKKIVLRIFWDGDSLPAVESPIGDFFGLGLGEYFVYESGPLSVGSQKALNCYFPMPFHHSARITISNEGKDKIDAFYYNIDWQKHATLPENLFYFYAEYRQAQPNKGWTDDWKANSDPKVDGAKNTDGRNNYVMFEAEGPGHYVGVTQSILQNQGDWWGEGDDMMFIDDDKTPHILGTGSEDYYLGAWCYGNCGINPFGSNHPTFAFQRYGNPVNGGDDRGAKWTVYRFHTDSPVPFQKYFKMSIEHGHANHRSDNFYTVAYWYQKGPHKLRTPLPPVEDRIPRMFDTGGPTMGKP